MVQTLWLRSRLKVNFMGVIVNSGVLKGYEGTIIEEDRKEGERHSGGWNMIRKGSELPVGQ